SYFRLPLGFLDDRPVGDLAVRAASDGRNPVPSRTAPPREASSDRIARDSAGFQPKASANSIGRVYTMVRRKRSAALRRPSSRSRREGSGKARAVSSSTAL